MSRAWKQVILPGFDEVTMIEAIQNEKGTETFIVPTMLKRLIEHPRFAEFDLSSLAIPLYGAAPIDDMLLAKAMRALPKAGFWQIYGMTELSHAVTALPPWHHEPGTPRLRSAGPPVCRCRWWRCASSISKASSWLGAT